MVFHCIFKNIPLQINLSSFCDILILLKKGELLMPLYKVQKLTAKLKDKTIFGNINLAIEAGEFIAIVGQSGSGKSRLLEHLALYNTDFSGDIFFKNTPVTKLSWYQKWKIKKQLVYMKQNDGLELHKTAFQNVLAGRKPHLSFYRRIFNKPSVSDHVLVMDYLEKVGLLELSERNVDKLSGGERRRVAIARATIQEPDILFIDEPITGLDRHSAETIMDDLKRLNLTKKTTLICVMSQLDMVEKYAARIIGLSQGTISFDISGRRLTSDEKNKLI
jgi:phosphonate transport system ATP-binding protein